MSDTLTAPAAASPVYQNLKRNVPVPLIGKPLRLYVTVAGQPRVWVMPDPAHAGDYILTQNYTTPAFPGMEGEFEHFDTYVQPGGTAWHLWRCPRVVAAVEAMSGAKREVGTKKAAKAPRPPAPPPPAAPDVHVEGDREEDAAKRAIERRREVVARMVGEGQTTKDIAEYMGLPETTIRSDRVALKKGG